MVITSWLSALSSKFFGKKLPPRMRKEPSKQGPQASATSEVLEERTLMSVNPVMDVYTEGVDEDHVFNVDAPGVLVNDPSGSGTRLAVQVTSTAVGVAVLRSDGSFTYTPGEVCNRWVREISPSRNSHIKSSIQGIKRRASHKLCSSGCRV